MTKLLQRVEVSLRSFYIFKSSYGQKEGEEAKKILYYYPNDIEINTKIKDVGLSEAIITFTGTFTSENDCKALHTQKTTQVFYQPEPGFWMVMVLNVPKEIKSKNEVEVAEYRGNEVCDRIYHAVLSQCYFMYRLQNGTFQNVALNSSSSAEHQRHLLVDQLQKFYDNYLISRKQLVTNCDSDIIDMLQSIQYLPLDKALFLRSHNFNNILCATFPVITECIMLYNEQIVCGGKLSANDLHCLQSYVLKHVLESSINTSTILTSSNSTVNDAYQNGGFVRDGVDESQSPLILYLTLESQLKPYYLLVYRALNVTLCLFIDGKEPQIKSEFYEELHSYMSPQLTCLARDIANEVCKQIVPIFASDCPSLDSNPKYLFINEQSLKHHTNIQRPTKNTQQSIPRNVMTLIADLSKPSGDACATEELQVKTTNDFWIVKRRCNWRQYYVILCNSAATLVKVTQEAKRIFEQELKDDVFFDK